MGPAAPDDDDDWAVGGEEDEAPDDEDGGVVAEAPPPASSRSWSNSKEVLWRVRFGHHPSVSFISFRKRHASRE